ncbi:hypothetical protein F0L17_23005 [Streptomyces sp. TRM43335]|uniref:Uncharacterized protein n=1 Tax=Streptomyces taklimakanensis TaxID=2569853 RepID=A0A6G2BI35_9ACTN|nr:DUF6397 family protein [Streptomyces taklimakanensis]MTE21928.1 hypothetical protein [Streptomyces taklimakanensis]
MSVGVVWKTAAGAAARSVPGSPPAGEPPAGSPREAVSMAAARRALGLKPRELELAVEFGEIEAVTPTPSVRGRRGRLIPVAELVRLRTEEGFPATLRERTRLVGAGEGADLMGISRARFARLARAGCFGPARFSLNRYRAVIWFYRATELREVAEHQPALLRGPLPEGVRRLVEQGEDWRPRHWRNRRIAHVTRHTADPWAAAAAHAAVLAPKVLAEAVPDPLERARLAELRPELVTVRPDSPQARRVVRGLLTADGEEETLWHRLGLTLALGTARSARPLTSRTEDGSGSAPQSTARNNPSCTTEAINRPHRS